MPLPPVRKNNLDASTNALLSAIREKEILDGRMIYDVELESGGENLVNHGLNRKFQGYIVARKSADANIWDSLGDIEDRQIVLHTDANVTVDLWVF